MKIKSNRKLENNDKKSYNIIYQKIKEEIKSVVITKLLNQIQNLYKKYEKLKKENSIIKNDLIYILKRVLLNKNDFNASNNNNNVSGMGKNYQSNNIYSINGLKNNSYLNSKSYNSFLSSTEKLNRESSNYNQLYYNYYNKNNNSMNRNQIEKRRYSIDDDFKKCNSSSCSHLENSLQFNIQNKIDHYLNSLYKHNFSEECIAGTASAHLLNKNNSIYDELFSNKNRNKSLSHVNTDFNYRKISNQKNRKNLLINDDENTDGNYRNKNNKSQNKIGKNQTNSNYLKVHRKGIIKNGKPKTNEYNKKKINSGSKSSGNMISNSSSKASRYISSQFNSRSRFLINKF